MGAKALRAGGCFCPVPLAWRSQLGTGFPKSCWKEPDVGLVAELGDRENPWSSLRTCVKPAFRSALPSRTLPRRNFECCCSPSGSVVHTKHTQSCACARSRLQAEPGLMVTAPISCPAQEDAGKMPQRGRRLLVTSLGGTGINSRREAGREGP